MHDMRSNGKKRSSVSEAKVLDIWAMAKIVSMLATIVKAKIAKTKTSFFKVFYLDIYWHNVLYYDSYCIWSSLSSEVF